MYGYGTDYRHPDLVKFLRKHSLLTDGPYTLASGAQSDYYIDCRLTSFHQEGSKLIALSILDELRKQDQHIDLVGGVDMGATPIVSVVAACSWAYLSGFNTVHAFVIRKNMKEHGTQKQIEGIFYKNARVAIIEDVVTTGNSLLKAVEVVKNAGAKVITVISVIDRGSDLEEKLKDLNITYQPLVTLKELLI